MANKKESKTEAKIIDEKKKNTVKSTKSKSTSNAKKTNTTKKTSTVKTNSKKVSTSKNTSKKNTTTKAKKTTQVKKDAVVEDVKVKNIELAKVLDKDVNNSKDFDNNINKQEIIEEINNSNTTKMEDAKFPKKKDKKMLAIGIFIVTLGIIALFISLVANRIIDREFLSDNAITLMMVASIIIESFGAFVIINES